MLSDWIHAHGSSLMQREQHKIDVKKKHEEPQFCSPNICVGSQYEAIGKRHIQNPATILRWSVLQK